MSEKEYAENCFVCGEKNPIGLHLKTKNVNGKSHLELDVHENLSGFDGLMHGGFICMLLDEVMFHAVESSGETTLTLNINTNFVNPALIGHHLVVEAWIANRQGRKIYVEGKVTDGDKVVADAKGLYLRVDMDSFLKTI
ncbi:thioesterase [Desulfitobacterium hafniense]|uniref:Acyl-coenzyme A thioesterase THEM4 n=1 Tax=Desulfitobacterium hafniense TaxID=49338 RepID=A0A0W1JPS1_DESHA|nr:PaaI family thioesterase [Desulfitobacterium hafniense]KTE93716.1 thioesterase [Desulfitobacterium hafniense]